MSRTVYEAANAIEAQMLQDLLKQDGIATRIDGAFLQGAVGELQAGGLVRLVVENDGRLDTRTEHAVDGSVAKTVPIAAAR